MEWEEHFPDGRAMVQGAKQRIEGEEKPIRYVNGRYKLCGEPESRWLYNICIPAASDCLQKKFERENHGKKIFECDTRAFARIVKFKSGEFRI